MNENDARTNAEIAQDGVGTNNEPASPQAGLAATRMPPASRDRWVFAASVVALIAASAFAGAMVHRMFAGSTNLLRQVPPSNIAVFLEHATLDLRLGRGAAVLKPLGEFASRAKEPALKDRLFALWAEAALQAGRLGEAEALEAQREAWVADAQQKRTLRVRRMMLLGMLGRDDEARALAASLLGENPEPAAADEIRLRLHGATMTEDELRAWIAKVNQNDLHEVRAAGMCALKLLRDAKQAQPLLETARVAGQGDLALAAALVEVYTVLGQPRDVARVAETTRGIAGNEAGKWELLRAQALVQADDVDAAAHAIEALLTATQEPEVRRAAKRLRYELMRRTGRLKSEIAALEKRGDRATRAWLALEVEGNAALAVELYERLLQEDPDAIALQQGLADARRRKDLMERKVLYEQVLAKDPNDSATQVKFLEALVSLGDAAAVREVVGRLLEGKDNDAEALLQLATLLGRLELWEDAVALLGQAHAAETDPLKKQRILLVAADVYAASRPGDSARRLLGTLAERGGSSEIRDLALVRLTSLLERR